MHYVDVGFSNYIDANKIIAISRPESSPARRLIARAKEEGRYIDLTQGKKTRSIIISACGDNTIVTATAVHTYTVINRINKLKNALVEEEKPIEREVV